MEMDVPLDFTDSRVQFLVSESQSHMTRFDETKKVFGRTPINVTLPGAPHECSLMWQAVDPPTSPHKHEWYSTNINIYIYMNKQLHANSTL